MRWNGKAALFAVIGLAYGSGACGGARAANPFPGAPASSSPSIATVSPTAVTTSQPGAASSATAAPVVVTQLAARGGVTCARLADASVRCWGDNDFRVVSPVWSEDRAVRRPVVIAGLPPVAEIAVVEASACARLVDGTVRCWGTDDGTLGTGAPLPPGPPPYTDKPMPVLGLGNVVTLSGYSHLCAQLVDKTALCWHDYDSGTGDPRDAGSRKPVAVPSFANAVQISVGQTLACALMPTGKVRCWHDVSPGLIPRGKVRVDPIQVASLDDATSISTGAVGGCAITKARTLKCWGEVAFMRPENQPKNTAYAIPGLADVVQVAVAYETVCVLVASGALLCDKMDFHGPHAAAAVPGVTDVAEIALGYEHTCVRTKDGRVLCWGDNTFGQLGDGTTTSRAMPAPVRF